MKSPEIFDKAVRLVTGKGGVGKTMWTAALALASARRGLRVLRVEADAAARETDDRSGSRESPGMAPVPAGCGIWAVRIDPVQVLREYVHTHVKVPFVAGAITRAGLFEHIAEGTPGLRELMILGQIWRWSRGRIPEAPAVDRVIVDAPATGHFRSLLRQPRALADLMKSGPLVEQTRRVRALLEDPARTGIGVVTLPEELPVNETLEFLGDPEMVPLVDRVIVNAMVPDFFSGSDAETVLERCRETTGDLPPDLDAARRLILRRRAQDALLRRLREAWGGPVTEMPFSFAAARGAEEGVAEMADRLDAEAAGDV